MLLLPFPHFSLYFRHSTENRKETHKIRLQEHDKEQAYRLVEHKALIY